MSAWLVVEGYEEYRKVLCVCPTEEHAQAVVAYMAENDNGSYTNPDVEEAPFMPPGTLPRRKVLLTLSATVLQGGQIHNGQPQEHEYAQWSFEPGVEEFECAAMEGQFYPLGHAFAGPSKIVRVQGMDHSKVRAVFAEKIAELGADLSRPLPRSEAEDWEDRTPGRKVWCPCGYPGEIAEKLPDPFAYAGTWTLYVEHPGVVHQIIGGGGIPVAPIADIARGKWNGTWS